MNTVKDEVVTVFDVIGELCGLLKEEALSIL